MSNFMEVTPGVCISTDEAWSAWNRRAEVKNDE